MTDPFAGAELVLEYETGAARRAVVVQENDEGKVPYRQEDWALGANGWRFNGSRPVEEFTLDRPAHAD
jgi:hypothetical protein